MEKYFKCYEDLDVQKLMLEDDARVEAYKNAIFNNKELFRDKVVMDVGAGTGLLSVFCCQVGARIVYAVEASGLAEMTSKVAFENGFSQQIKVIHSKVEDIDIKLEPVDVIISEWMGFYLVHEGMLDSVLYARDNFLKKDGLLFPSVAKLHIALCQLPSVYKFWEIVHGVKMECIGKKYREAKSKTPGILHVDKNDLISDSSLVTWLDLRNVEMEELDCLAGEEYVLVCNKTGLFQGICIWFTVEFPDGSVLSTEPSKKTHWKQTVVVLPEEIKIVEGEPAAFKLSISRTNSNKRMYNIELLSLDAEVIEHNVPCDCHMTKCIVTAKYLEQLEENKKLSQKNN